jgi:hypothetical protein
MFGEFGYDFLFILLAELFVGDTGPPDPLVFTVFDVAAQTGGQSANAGIKAKLAVLFLDGDGQPIGNDYHL